jgi:hypothetical protein
MPAIAKIHPQNFSLLKAIRIKAAIPEMTDTGSSINEKKINITPNDSNTSS